MACNAFCYRDEAQQVREEQQYHKFHQKQMQAQQDSAWAHSVPEWHEAELVGQNKPWTVPSQLLTAEEEVSLDISLLPDAAESALDCAASAVEQEVRASEGRKKEKKENLHHQALYYI